jgi:hypothetical protein
MKEKLKVIIGSRGTSRVPDFAGSTWVRMQYLLGLERLGVEAYWIDRVKPIDPLAYHHSLEYITARFHRLARDFGFEDRYCLVYNEGEKHFGLTSEQVAGLCEEADLLLNISGHLPPSSPLNRIPRRAYVDLDPGFTQLWGAQHLHFAPHNFFFTVGQNIGTERFLIPTNGIQWKTILPPVVLDQWPARIDERCERFSTIADWDAVQSAAHDGNVYGGKQEEIKRFIEVPRLAAKRVEVAMSIHQVEHEAQGILLENGWKLCNPYFHAGDVESYREFVQFSRAEWSVAKEGYVKTNSGWVSDRTACYLASGKPAVVQSTGFESSLPVGCGLLTFRNVDEAVSGLQQVDAAYLEHCTGARRIAEEYFDSDRVLGGILDHVGLG